MKDGLSIIISYHNEPYSFIQECVEQLLSTIDIKPYEVLVVDDGSEVPLKPIKGTKIIRHEINQGVGRAFDTGIANAKYDNIFIMANDIRFIPNKWASLILKEIIENPKAITCTACVRLSDEELDIQKQLDGNWFSLGATIKMFSDKNNTPGRGNQYRSTIDAQWLPVINTDILKDSYPIPCILGAAYGVKKQWYQYIGGWEGHKRWSTLEPYISIKSWMFGGECRVAPKVQIGHIYKKSNPHGVTQPYILWNKYLVSTLLAPNPQKYIGWMAEFYNNPTNNNWMEYYKEWLTEKREEYKSKTVLSWDDFLKKFDISDEPPQKIPTDDEGLTGAPEEGAKYYDDIFMGHPSNARYQPIYRKIAQIAGDRKLLDIGCGSAKLQEHIKNYQGFDFIPNMIAELQDKGVDVWLGDIHDKANFKEADVYCSIEVLEHIIKDVVVVGNIPEGKDVILSLPSFGGRGHVRKYTEQYAIDRYKDLLDIHKVSYFTMQGGIWTESTVLTEPFILFIEATKHTKTKDHGKVHRIGGGGRLSHHPQPGFNGDQDHPVQPDHGVRQEAGSVKSLRHKFLERVLADKDRRKGN